VYVIIVGGGKVGYYLAKELVDQGHEILVIERDRQTADRVAEELGSVVLAGDGCEAATLDEAGTARADALVAATGDDEDNLVACQVAKLKFKVPRTIARINNPKNEAIFKTLGIDITISATQVIMEHIQQEFPDHPPIHLMTLRDRGLEVVEVRIPPNARIVGHKVKDITLPPESVLSLVISDRRGPVVPNGDTVLEADDEVVAVTRVDQEQTLRRTLTGS
jgi:trk system potassium uptake protein TrkA